MVHDLRYRIAFGDDAPNALAAQGHGYLTAVAPLLAVVGMVALASFVQRLAGGPAAPRARRASIWLAMAGGLLAVFCLQEMLEGLLSTGRPDGLDGIFGQGGWLAVPLSMAVAGVGLLVVRLVGVARFRGVATRLVRTLFVAAPVRGSLALVPRRRAVLARHLAGRSPPPALA